jgi:mediator of RNA polymerase II transcription subunit 31
MPSSENELISESSSTEISSDDEAEQPVKADEPPSAEPLPEEQPSGEVNDPRFIRELEFVQCLSNPDYLDYLVKQHFFADPAFINYLKYLLYWTTPAYSKYLRFPQCLHFLRLLQDRDFRTHLEDPSTIEEIKAQQERFFECYRRNRLDLILPDVNVKEPGTE